MSSRVPLTKAERIEAALDRVERRGDALVKVAATRERIIAYEDRTTPKARPQPTHYGYAFSQGHAFKALCGETISAVTGEQVETPVSCRKCLPFASAIEKRGLL